MLILDFSPALEDWQNQLYSNRLAFDSLVQDFVKLLGPPGKENP